MALATQCPHCQTIFRVAHDQLKLRAGLVRCGACKEIFNGIENLLRPEDALASAATTATAASTAVSAAIPATGLAKESGVGQGILPSSAAGVLEAIAPTPGEARWPDLPATPAMATTAKPVEVNPEEYFPAVFFDPPAASSPPRTADSTLHAEPPIPRFFSEGADPLDRMTLIHVSGDINHIEPDHADLPSDEGAEFESGENAASISSSARISAEISASNSSSLIQRSAHETPDELDQAIDYLQRKPWRGSKKNVSRVDIEGPRNSNNHEGDQHHAEVPEFVARSRSVQQRRGTLRKLQYAAGALLMMAALVQSIYLLHDQLAARLPASRPVWDALCSVLGCRVEFPAQIDAVSIESNELIALPSLKNNFSLNLLLRNHSSLPQRWPAIELTLLDGNDRPLVRRVFSPVEYLPATMPVKAGFAQNTEQTTRIKFESSQQKAANYRVVLFYP